MEILILFGLMGAIFYFLLIRPQRRRQSEHRGFIESLRTGDKVITIGGIYGEVAEIDETEIVLTVEDGSRIKFMRSSVMGMQPPEENGEEEIEEDDEVVVEEVHDGEERDT